MLRVSKTVRISSSYRKIRKTPTNPLKCSLKDPKKVSKSILEGTHCAQNFNSVLTLCYPHGRFT